MSALDGINSDSATGSKKPLCPTYETRDGWTIVQVHHSVVPHYDYEEACKGLSEQGIQRELEINWEATTGKLVYPEFRYATHVALEPLKWRGETLFCGWDLAHLGTPAFVPTWINAYGQWCLAKGVAPMEDETVGVYEMGERVAAHMLEHYCIPNDISLKKLVMVHFGDPQGNARPPRTKATERHELRSAFDIIRRGLLLPDCSPDPDHPGFGWRIRGGAVSNTERQSAVRARLMALVRGLPAVVVCPTATPLTEGFNGKFCYPERADGTYEDSPEKNWWSHSVNAVEYCATRLLEPPRAEEDEEETEPRFVRSRAAGRDW